ncbi:MAG: DUF3808 domain-containing protein [Ignavibacteria bacterium]|nr:DUF3808 domain-containing protein [Ignavibacteria bacterium]
MKIILTYSFLILIFFSTHLTYANHSDNNYFSKDPIDQEILQGLSNIYNLQFEEAERKFNQLQKSYPKDVKSFFYESQVQFYKALMLRDDLNYEKFLDLSNNVINKCEDILDEDENNTEALYYKGISYSYRSLIMISLNKSLFKAALNGNSGYRILKDIIEENPNYYDAYMGLGLYKIAIGYVPGKFRWILSILGFDGSIKEGINYLHLSMDKGKFTKVDSRVFLSIFSMREKEEKNPESVQLMKPLTIQYPKSPVFKIMYAGFLQQIGKVDESFPLLYEALKLNVNSMQDEINKGAYALLGYGYFRKNNFIKTIESFEEYLKYVNDEEKYNVILFTLGSCYEITGRRKKGIQYYNSVREKFIDDRDGEGEKFFYRYAKENINDPISEYDSMMVVGMNLRESNHLDESLNHFLNFLSSDLPKKFSTDDDKVTLYYELGNTYLYMGNNDKAIEYFDKCVDLNPRRETWIVPHSYFELGKIYTRLGNKEKAEEMFDRIDDYSDYDMESLLDMRVISFKERM